MLDYIVLTNSKQTSTDASDNGVEAVPSRSFFSPPEMRKSLRKIPVLTTVGRINHHHQKNILESDCLNERYLSTRRTRGMRSHQSSAVSHLVVRGPTVFTPKELKIKNKTTQVYCCHNCQPRATMRPHSAKRYVASNPHARTHAPAPHAPAPPLLLPFATTAYSFLFLHPSL